MADIKILVNNSNRDNKTTDYIPVVDTSDSQRKIVQEQLKGYC